MAIDALNGLGLLVLATAVGFQIYESISREKKMRFADFFRLTKGENEEFPFLLVVMGKILGLAWVASSIGLNFVLVSTTKKLDNSSFQDLKALLNFAAILVLFGAPSLVLALGYKMNK